MGQVKEGDSVDIHFKAVGKNRRVLASTDKGPPLTIVAGGQEVLYGLSFGIIGMEHGEEAVLQIDAEDAFGDSGAAVERAIPRSRFPADVQVGDALRLTEGDSSLLLWVVEEGAGDTWRLSNRHPFAGQDVEVYVKVLVPSGS